MRFLFTITTKSHECRPVMEHTEAAVAPEAASGFAEVSLRGRQDSSTALQPCFISVLDYYTQLLGYAKEVITIDIYGDTVKIIEDCLDDLQPFIDEVIPKEESESSTDFSDYNSANKSANFLHKVEILA